MKPENGAEKTHFVLGELCIQIFEWNDHYIKDNAINDIIIFDVSDQKYYNWAEFMLHIPNADEIKDSIPGFTARKELRRLRYKVFKPINSIPKKRALKTKKKIENKFVLAPGAN